VRGIQNPPKDLVFGYRELRKTLVFVLNQLNLNARE